MISGSSTVFIIAAAFAFALPIGLAIWWKIKTGAKLWAFIAGAFCFTLFAYVLEALLHQFVLGGGALTETITGSPVYYMLYGAFAAGIFEETARLFGFKVLLKNRRESECAVAYGIGHGGIEAILVLGVTYLVYVLVSFGVQLGDAESTAQIVATVNAIPEGTPFFAMFERISAVILHIGLSMIMFAAVKERGKLWLYPVSICLHALADMPACLYQYGIITSLFVIETLAFAMAIIYLLIGRRVLAGYRERQDRGERLIWNI